MSVHWHLGAEEMSTGEYGLRLKGQSWVHEKSKAGNCIEFRAEQAPASVTTGAVGELTPVGSVLEDYAEVAIGAVNVNWHLGAAHESAGEYDLPGTTIDRRLGIDEPVLPGFRFNAKASLLR